ncbi:hypothetical protein UWK_01962 [Desulfocapsa sulfexigens DSM 10523]|uniref:SGNH hydrolase-type esterase domain-containing protein n=1 Tax=Desulfocapsa sulfexigens (strain DSM 10523 / SB164P1) TaxID=1167006 RepID=M1PA60_DESSD|nr:SGNH/GDSL hydrolase family protein [Desulfocapsa sulfexigens]AGF78512.1 hypothetical protein UWK_01962 [Desulfocapsa sulfexigens DSM 10523]
MQLFSRESDRHHGKAKTYIQKGLLFVGVLTLCLLILEITVRYYCQVDSDGNYRILGRVLKPYHLAINTFAHHAQDYSNTSHSRVVYDEYLGWTPRVSNISANGQYCYNSLGARVDDKNPIEYKTAKPQDILRILIIGDSYSHGDEVPFQNTFGYYLEQLLNTAGIPAEVINLAVGGYGIDQALLRWRHSGRTLSADIVLLGLQFEDIQRNVNIIRSIYMPASGLPFSKPRYILQNNSLQLLNVPTLPPEEIMNILRNPLTEWDLAQYEQFLTIGNYEEHIIYKSKLIAMLTELFFPVEENSFFYNLSYEPAQLAMSLLDTFQSEIEQYGSQFIVVHIPNVIDVIKKRFTMEPKYSGLLSEIEKNHLVYKPLQTLAEQSKKGSLFNLYMEGGHYSAVGNKIIAQVIAENLIKQTDESTIQKKTR